MSLQLDHLVVVADTLEQGVVWCTSKLGVEPGPGGRHALMGTHNRLAKLRGSSFAEAYLEIIAIDPAAAAPSRVRWFGMDTPALREAAQAAPRLVHWVARTNSLDEVRRRLVAAGCDPGPALAAERDTPQGVLRWRITVPDDGKPLARGAVPTLIEWSGRHPSQAMPDQGVELLGVELGGVPPCAADALDLADVPGVRLAREAAAPPIRVRLRGPRGELLLDGGSP